MKAVAQQKVRRCLHRPLGQGVPGPGWRRRSVESSRVTTQVPHPAAPITVLVLESRSPSGSPRKPLRCGRHFQSDNKASIPLPSAASQLPPCPAVCRAPARACPLSSRIAWGLGASGWEWTPWILQNRLGAFAAPGHSRARQMIQGIVCTQPQPILAASWPCRCPMTANSNA